MALTLQEVVKFRSDRLFNGAVNINWFDADDNRARLAASSFVFHGPQYHGVEQQDVGTSHGHALQDSATFSRAIIRRAYGIEDQPFTLAIAGYGTGKSHLGLTLAALLRDPDGSTANDIIESITSADNEIASEVRAIIREAAQPCLVVALNGMQNFDLSAELMRQVLRQVKARGLDGRPLDELRPRFVQAAHLFRMSNDELRKELLSACDITNPSDLEERLAQQDESTYLQVHTFFA